jgi:hypothetical protein
MLDRTRSTLPTVTVLAGLYAAIPGASAADILAKANTTVLGPNVYVFDPAMPAAEIRRIVSEVFAKMEANQFGPERFALLFKPGTYEVAFNVSSPANRVSALTPSVRSPTSRGISTRRVRRSGFSDRPHRAAERRPRGACAG